MDFARRAVLRHTALIVRRATATVGLTRRTFLITGALGATGWAAGCAGALPARGAGGPLWVAPRAMGSGTGARADDAAGASDFSQMCAEAAGSGRPLYLLADAGPYRVGKGPFAILKRGGSAEAPFTIEGRTRAGAPGRAAFIGGRADPWSPEGASGPEIFRLLKGADHIAFRGLAFENCGNGCLRIGGTVTGLTVEDCSARNVQRFLETSRSGGAGDASLSHAVFRRCETRGFSKSMFRFAEESHTILVEDCLGDSEGQDGDNFAMGVHLRDRVHDVVFRRVTMRNCHDIVRHKPKRYFNGDGFVAERETRALLFEDCEASGCTDSGFDLKSLDTRLVRCRAIDNKRNFRLWGTAELIDCVAALPNNRGGVGGAAQIWVGGKAAEGIAPDAILVVRPRLEDGAAEGSDIICEEGRGMTLVDPIIVPARVLRFAPEGAAGRVKIL